MLCKIDIVENIKLYVVILYVFCKEIFYFKIFDKIFYYDL